tara:strand:- start:314 stop:916 length:603 start_codon:yes stop_codon:yes gene_type:complete
MERKKKLRIIQLSLLVMGTIIIFFTYLTQEERISESLIPKETQEKIKNQTSSGNENSDVFYNIEYSGLDLAGNRYILKSKEAFNNKDQQEIVNMKFVEAIFYFKDETNLNVTSNSGVYNNRTLDMNFYGNVKAKYEGSELFAEKAEYSNSKGYLVISEKVKVKDLKGTMVADELLFDIKNQTLDIASFNDSKINANVNLK